MKWRNTALLSLSIGACVIVGLTGCESGDDVRTDLTVEDAKSTAQAAEDDMVDQLPTSALTDTEQLERGSLLSCRGDRNYRWAGGTVAYLEDDGDLAMIVDDLYIAYVSRKGWSVSRSTSAAGGPRLSVRGPQDQWLVIDGLDDPARLDASSLSPCFHLPDGMTPHGEF